MPPVTYALALAGSLFLLSPMVAKIRLHGPPLAYVGDDPSLGKETPAAIRYLMSDVAGTRYVVFLRGCACNSDTLRALVAEVGDSWPIVVIVLGSDRRAEEAVRKLRLPIVVKYDPQMVCAGQLNATYAPRAFVVSAEGVLLWKQDDPRQSVNEAARQALSDLGVRHDRTARRTNNE
jgi:hypothetical protein